MFQNYGTNYDAFAAFDREILAAQGSQVYGQNGSTEDVPGLNRSSSEEKELTPQQSKRKAQNRAAQRAFRERKERHVKELEEKLSTLEASSSNVLSENERLKREIQKITTENQILRATSAAQAAHQPPAPAAVDVGPMAYSPTDFYDVVLEPHKNKTPSHRISHHPETGESLLGAAAAWDLITNDPLYIDGQVDIQAVSEFLKPKAKCDGQGPVFPESEVLAEDLLNPSPIAEARKHKLKTLVPAPRSFFMDVKCPGCYVITTVFSHAQTVVICGSCATVLCQPTGGKARLTEGCSFRKK
ncbi:hypothetical protein TWF703_007062 [Orbilia oligospora]|uniref:40S ribosomal protein S27 n=1 Tax=Orbilia oligospora TaxID=2813651 RepID=A0A7C8NSB5_ORBOL|nr:hypothetical protein TWF703_007062 [Orbilia oligospora]